MGGSPLRASLTASPNLLVGRLVTPDDAVARTCGHCGFLRHTIYRAGHAFGETAHHIRSTTMTVIAAAALRGHDLRRDVGAGRPHRRREPGPGLSRRGRPARDAQDRRERDRRGRQPVPARAGHRAAAGGDRRAAQAALRHRVRPGHRGAGDRRRHRGHRRRGPRARRAGLRGAADRAVLRLLLPRHRDGRLPATGRADGARRPRFRDRRRRVASRGDAADQGVDPQLAAQPDRHGGHRRRACGDRRPRGGRRPAGDHRRGLRASGVRRPPPPPAGQLSGHGRADDHHLERGQDVQLSPAGRSDGPAAQPISSPACGRPSSI